VLLSLQRLLAARDALQAALALPAPPPVIVTAAEKDVVAVAARLGLPPEAAYCLYDDNPGLAGRPRVITVPRYDRLGPAERAALAEYLDERLPLDQLTGPAAAFLADARHPARAPRFAPRPTPSTPPPAPLTLPSASSRPPHPSHREAQARSPGAPRPPLAAASRPWLGVTLMRRGGSRRDASAAVGAQRRPAERACGEGVQIGLLVFPYQSRRDAETACRHWGRLRDWAREGGGAR
jgi:hypothetical protein